MSENLWKPWSVKYKEMVNGTKGMTAEEPADPFRKKMKTKIAFQTTLDTVRGHETEESNNKTSDKSSSKTSESKKPISSVKV